MAFTRVNPEDCTTYPFNDEQWLDLANLEAGEKVVIGIKTELPEDICPNNYTDVNFTMVSPDGSAHPWKLGSNGIWSFRICWKGWTQFKRSDGRTVCMKLVNKTGISKYDIGQECYSKQPPYYASVAGVDSYGEIMWMRKEAAKYSSSGGEQMYYWTSGVRDGTCEGTDPYDKKNNFKWEDGMTTGYAIANSEFSCKDEGVAKNCLVLRGPLPNRPLILYSDFDCESTVSIGGGFCIYDLWRGIE